ncbi:MAG TPA: hypothetical protein VHC44_06105 [Verrucomicrobiae bacterium]|nr:hypothetical protein [Verrucomicrobiae bacterium]
MDPHSTTNLAKLAALGERAAAADKKQSKAEKKAARNTEDLKNLSAAELRKRFSTDEAKHDARAYRAIGQLAEEALKANDAPARDARVKEILEIQAGIRNTARPLVPEKLGVFTSWIFFFKNLSGTIARGTTPAANLVNPATHGSDNGRSDPQPSTFWTRPKMISEEDLYAGFGRERFPHIEESVWNYSAPKTSSGTHGGFDVELNGERFKIKFGDLNSEPFTARIFYALGYHVDPTDYAPQVKVRYDRRLLREFHLRKPLTMKITPLGIHVGTIQLQTHYDPFAFITKAVFKDGHEISGAALKQMLLTNASLSHPEDSPANFRADVEAQLDYLVMAPANVQPRDGPTQSIGSWDFGELGHENLRELRGAGLLAAWLGWFDSRADNTKLRLVRDSDEVQLQHFFSDLGGGMGAGTGFFSPRGENPNDFTWTFTTPEIVRGPGRMTTPFRIVHFKPTVPTPAFANMTIDDARWMARLIGQLTENQLRAALIASGYDNAEAQLYLEKLINRRDQMILDLRLENEVPLLRQIRTNHDFSYSPGVDGIFVASVNKSTVSARNSTARIVNGKLFNDNSPPHS